MHSSSWSLLSLLSYIGTLSGVVLAIISLAAGLYYLAELIEVIILLIKK
jgi:hypothetical protein